MMMHVDELMARYAVPGDQGWVAPAYDGASTINLVSSLLAYFGVKQGTPLQCHDALARTLGGRRKVIFLLLDGLGLHNLARATARRPRIGACLQPMLSVPLTTVFPSTTATAMTSYLTGLPPLMHGVVGYLMYFPEFHQVFNMLNFHSPDAQKTNLVSLGFTPERFVGRPPMLHPLREAGVMAMAFTYQPYVESGLSRLIYQCEMAHPYLTVGDMLETVTGLLPTPVPQFHFLYWSTLDTIAHAYGAGSGAYARELQMLTTTIHEQLLPLLDGDTALIISADHGHIDDDECCSIDLSASPELTRRFRVPPAGDGRATHLFVQPGEEAAVTDLLHALGAMTVLRKNELLARGWLGNGPVHEGLLDRLGDLLVLPHGSRRAIFAYQPRLHTTMTGRHGGLSPEEMVVPLMVFTRG